MTFNYARRGLCATRKPESIKKTQQVRYMTRNFAQRHAIRSQPYVDKLVIAVVNPPHRSAGREMRAPRCAIMSTKKLKEDIRTGEEKVRRLKKTFCRSL